MKTITAITVQQKNKNKSNIYIDGEYYCSLSNITVLSNRLKAGDVLQEDDFEKIVLSDNESSSFDLALTYVSKYSKTKKQVAEYLQKKGYTYPVACKTVDKLVSYGYINDADFAERFVLQYKNGKGKRYILQQLRLKGIDEKCAYNAINKHFEDETPTAVTLAEKYMKGKEGTYENYGKCYRHLLSKGIAYETASEAISCIKKDQDDN